MKFHLDDIDDVNDDYDNNDDDCFDDKGVGIAIDDDLISV